MEENESKSSQVCLPSFASGVGGTAILGLRNGSYTGQVNFDAVWRERFMHLAGRKSIIIIKMARMLIRACAAFASRTWWHMSARNTLTQRAAQMRTNGAASYPRCSLSSQLLYNDTQSRQQVGREGPGDAWPRCGEGRVSVVE